jgi:hypothetical protein
MFLYDGGSVRGCFQHYSKFIGKKRKDSDSDSDRFLTPAEWNRFGMNLSWDKAKKQWMKKAGDVDAEEGRSEATTGSKGDAVEDKIKPSQPAATGTRRKAEDKGSSSKRKRVARKK